MVPRVFYGCNGAFHKHLPTVDNLDRDGCSYKEQHVRLTTVSTSEDYVLYRRRLLRWWRRMNDWVDPDFYKAQTFTEVILYPNTPLSSSEKQFFAITLAPAIANSTPPTTNDLAEILQALEDATANQIGNQLTQAPDTNLLRRLPPELILDMAELLGPTDLLSLRASCQWTCQVVDLLSKDVLQDKMLKECREMIFSPHTTTEAIQHLAARDDVALRFHRDRFRKLALTEIFARTLHGKQAAKALCGFCLDFHAVTFFSTAELTKGPYERKCMGALSSYRLCEHMHLSLQDIINLRQECHNPRRYQERRYPLCTEGRCASGIPFSSYFTAAYPEGTLMFHQHFKLPDTHIEFVPRSNSSHNPFQNTPTSYPSSDASSCSTDEEKISLSLMNITHSDVRDLLAALDEYICPHLRTASPGGFSGSVGQCRSEETKQQHVVGERQGKLWDMELWYSLLHVYHHRTGLLVVWSEQKGWLLPCYGS